MMPVLPRVILYTCQVSSSSAIFLRAIYALSTKMREINRKSLLMQEILPISNKTLKLYFGGQRTEAWYGWYKEELSIHFHFLLK